MQTKPSAYLACSLLDALAIDSCNEHALTLDIVHRLLTSEGTKQHRALP